MESNKQKKHQILLDFDSVSSVFAHDISSPLSIAKMNADLLKEYTETLSQYFSQSSENIPHHIQVALEKAPELICKNIASVQSQLQDYKDFLNSLDIEGYSVSNVESHVDTPEKANIIENLRILLVDDEQIHHDIGDAVLSKAHQISHVSSGLEAIERCKSEAFDIILMDLQMPNMSGQETVQHLKLLISSGTKIIGLTSMPIERQKKELTEYGFSDFLDKPLKPGRLEKLLGQENTP